MKRVKLTTEAINRGVWPCLSKKYAGMDLADIRGTVISRSRRFPEILNVRWDGYKVVERINSRWVVEVECPVNE
jgi:hypothetical protein